MCCNHPKIWTRWLYHRVMLSKDADRMANSVDCDQIAPSRAVWFGCTLFAQTCQSENLGSGGLLGAFVAIRWCTICRVHKNWLGPQDHSDVPSDGSRNNFYGHSLPATDSNRAVVSYWQKYQHLVLVKHLGSLPRNSVDMTLARHDLNSVDWAIKLQNKQTKKCIRFVFIIWRQV